jgi:hypothetical protein
MDVLKTKMHQKHILDFEFFEMASKITKWAHMHQKHIFLSFVFRIGVKN